MHRDAGVSPRAGTSQHDYGTSAEGDVGASTDVVRACTGSDAVLTTVALLGWSRVCRVERLWIEGEL